MVFNFAISDYRDNPTLIAPGNVFRCKEVLLQKTQIRTNVDFALIRLDRAVTNIPTIKLRTSGKISDDASLSLLGHPSGLPLKIVDNGTVKENHDDTYFKASIDAFAGNSGSPIFNNDTLQIEGMLIRGESDYEILGDCKRVRTCQHNECSGEIITRIQEIGKYSFLSNAFKDKFEAPISRPLPIPDMKEDGVSSQIKVNHRGRVKYLGVSYEVNHDNSFDLKISLTHPDGSEIVLDNSIRQETYHISKKYGVGGKYLPALENWAGKQSHGTWTLRFTDRYNRDIGHVLSASLTIIYE